MNSHLLSLFISYRSSGEKLIKYQANSSCVIMSVILMTTLLYKALILQGEIWCSSLLGLKGLSKGVFERRTSTGSKAFYRLIYLETTTFVLLCFFPLVQTFCLGANRGSTRLRKNVQTALQGIPICCYFTSNKLTCFKLGSAVVIRYGGPLEAPNFKLFSSLFFVCHNPTECSLIIVTNQLV